jgi:hypothetical protein
MHMTGLTKVSFGSLCLAAVGFAAATGLAIPRARAGAAMRPNYAVFYTGEPHDLDFSNSNVTGNIGIANSGGFVGSGYGTITGTVGFAAPNTGQYMPNGITVTGGATYGNANLQTDLNSLLVLAEISVNGSCQDETGRSDAD